MELFADSAQNRCEKGEQELSVQLPRKTSGVIVLAGTGVSKFVVILQQLLAAHTPTLGKLWKVDEFLGDFHIFLVFILLFLAEFGLCIMATLYSPNNS